MSMKSVEVSTPSTADCIFSREMKSEHGGSPLGQDRLVVETSISTPVRTRQHRALSFSRKHSPILVIRPQYPGGDCFSPQTPAQVTFRQAGAKYKSRLRG